MRRAQMSDSRPVDLRPVDFWAKVNRTCFLMFPMGCEKSGLFRSTCVDLDVNSFHESSRAVSRLLTLLTDSLRIIIDLYIYNYMILLVLIHSLSRTLEQKRIKSQQDDFCSVLRSASTSIKRSTGRSTAVNRWRSYCNHRVCLLTIPKRDIQKSRTQKKLRREFSVDKSLITSKDLSLEFRSCSPKKLSRILIEARCPVQPGKRFFSWDALQAREIIRAYLEREAEQMLRAENRILRRTDSEENPEMRERVREALIAQYEAREAQASAFPGSMESFRAVVAEKKSQSETFWG
jgi:hypothetical protein